MKTLTIILLSLFTLNAAAQQQFDNFKEAKTYLEELLNSTDGEIVTVFEGGYIIIDMGAACAGRYLFQLQDVAITQQNVEDYYRCGAMDDEVINISFECNDPGCILDPFMLELGPSSSGGLTFSNLKLGLKVYDTLIQLKRFRGGISTVD